MTTSRHRRLAALTAAVLSLGLSAAALPGTPAAAANDGSLRAISGPDPLPPAGTPAACGSSVEFQGWEQEPTVVVDPRNPDRLVAAWTQDYSDAIVTASSSDGGATWRTVVPKTTACTGGLAPYGQGSSALDSSLAYGPPDLRNGRSTVYLASLLVVASPVGFASWGVVVSTSTDNGLSWSDPVTVAQSAAPIYLDGTSIAADPVHPGRAYVAWRQGDVNYATRRQLIARTEDGGAIWTPGLPIADGYQLSGRLHVLRDGTVLNLMSSIPTPAQGTAKEDLTGPTTLLATRSVDLGLTWSAPVIVAVADDKHLTNLGSALGPDGTVYVGWQRAAGGTSSILVARSSSGGLTWAEPQLVATEPGDPLLPLFASPDMAVRRDGTVGIGFYDHRNATPSTPGISDYWLRTSRAGTGPWREQHVAGPFDVMNAPLGFVGDYQGLVALDRGFGSAIAVTGTGVATPPTDIVWTTTP